MASDNFLGMFGSSKRDREEEQKAFYAYFDGNHHKLVENQAKLMAAIKSLTKKIDEMQEKLDSLEQKLEAVPSASNHQSANPVFDTAGYVEAFVSDTPSYDDQYASPYAQPAPRQAAAAVPAPFYAWPDDDNGGLVAIDNTMKENAFFRVVPQSSDQATVEFNDLCVSTYLSDAYNSLSDSFDCIVDNKNPNNLVAENTTTAHLVGDKWYIDGKIRIRFV